jgi:molybdopterin converting factor small subunit
MIKVFIPTPLRKFTGDKSIFEVQAGTVHEAITSLGQSFPELKQYLFEPDGSIRKFVRVFLGDSDIHQLDGEQTVVKAGDEVSIIPAIAGGLGSDSQFLILDSRLSILNSSFLTADGMS